MGRLLTPRIRHLPASAPLPCPRSAIDSYRARSTEITLPRMNLSEELSWVRIGLSWAEASWVAPSCFNLPQWTNLNLPQHASDFPRFSVSISPGWAVSWLLGFSACVDNAVSARRQAGEGCCNSCMFLCSPFLYFHLFLFLLVSSLLSLVTVLW